MLNSGLQQGRRVVSRTAVQSHGRNGINNTGRLLPRGRIVVSRSLMRGRRTRTQSVGDNSYKEWMDYIKRKMVIFRGDMIRKRPFNIPLPLQRFLTSQRNTAYTLDKMTSQAKSVFTLSYSEISGHTAFLFSLCMFLETDIFNLRLFAVGSIMSSVVFQYYREVPLLIPIRWNILFILINIGMIGLLLRDYHEAEYLPKEEKELYLKYLAAEGMDKIDFMHLMARAQRQVVAPGQYFVKQGEMNYRVYYVANGSFEVLRDQDVAALLGPNTFVAEMGFVKWRDFMSQRQRVQAKKDEEIRRKETMIDFQAVSKELQRSLGYMGGTLATPSMEALEEEKAAAAKQQKATEEHIQQQQEERQQARSWQTWLGMKPRGSAEQARSSYTDVDKDGCVLDPASGYKIDVVNDGIVSSADVRAKKECIVYSWKFSDLEELMAQRTGAALVLERSFSSDLSRKMRKHDIQHKYKYVLMGLTLSCSELRAGEPIPPELALAVRKLQTEYGVSAKIHREVCVQLGLPSQLFAIDGATAGAGAGTGAPETKNTSLGAGTRSTNKQGKSGITKAGKKAAVVLASSSADGDKNSNKKNP